MEMVGLSLTYPEHPSSKQLAVGDTLLRRLQPDPDQEMRSDIVTSKRSEGVVPDPAFRPYR